MQPGDQVTSRDHERLLPLLKESQRKHGYISRETMNELARLHGIPIGVVFGVATFYSFLSTKPKGTHIIRICKSVPCYLHDAEMIIECVEKELGIGPGETTPDGRFSFELTNCIGACDQSPAMMINDEVFGTLTPAKIASILKSFDTEEGREEETDA